MNGQMIIAAGAITWLVVCAIFDWKTGEVSNWLTLPGMAAGIVYGVIIGGDRLIILAAAFIGLIVLFLLGSMGGADVKVLTALAGLWPAGLLAAMLVQGIWGAVVLIRKGRGAEFRAIPAYALGAVFSVVFLL
jgi:Flp pilus assembly protein protease CpaA